MLYLEIKFNPVIPEEAQSMLIAELLEIGFDSFSQGENDVHGYIPADIFNEDLLKSIGFIKTHPEISFDIKPLEDKNWNQEWESNYQPVTIAGKCHVRAPFHPPLKDIQYEIIIMPKMAFGTAHHETTRLMAEWLMTLDVKRKDVLDLGCGTGVLGILANKMGAASVIGIDNDEWAWKNAGENFRTNGLPEENVLLDDASSLKNNGYDLVLANINRNVLLNDMKAYFHALKDNGKLLLSGFYVNDIKAIVEEATKTGFRFAGSSSLNEWAVVLLDK
jgi:ribosomal protein L11 methyltransferase